MRAAVNPQLQRQGGTGTLPPVGSLQAPIPTPKPPFPANPYRPPWPPTDLHTHPPWRPRCLPPQRPAAAWPAARTAVWRRFRRCARGCLGQAHAAGTCRSTEGFGWTGRGPDSRRRRTGRRLRLERRISWRRVSLAGAPAWKAYFSTTTWLYCATVRDPGDCGRKTRADQSGGALVGRCVGGSSGRSWAAAGAAQAPALRRHNACTAPEVSRLAQSLGCAESRAPCPAPWLLLWLSWLSS